MAEKMLLSCSKGTEMACTGSIRVLKGFLSQMLHLCPPLPLFCKLQVHMFYCFQHSSLFHLHLDGILMVVEGMEKRFAISVGFFMMVSSHLHVIDLFELISMAAVLIIFEDIHLSHDMFCCDSHSFFFDLLNVLSYDKSYYTHTVIHFNASKSDLCFDGICTRIPSMI